MHTGMFTQNVFEKDHHRSPVHISFNRLQDLVNDSLLMTYIKYRVPCFSHFAIHRPTEWGDPHLIAVFNLGKKAMVCGSLSGKFEIPDEFPVFTAPINFNGFFDVVKEELSLEQKVGRTVAFLNAQYVKPDDVMEVDKQVLRAMIRMLITANLMADIINEANQTHEETADVKG